MESLDSGLKFRPQNVLRVKVKRCKGASVGKIRDKLDIPDPFVRIECTKALSQQKFRTKTIMNNPNAEWEETFSYILPEVSDKDPVILKVALYDEDLKAHDLIGKEELTLSGYTIGETKEVCVHFGKHGQLDLEVAFYHRTEPDFRYSLSIPEKERDIVCRRKEIAMNKMKEMFGEEDAPNSIEETPTISVIGSGGGYRAMMGYIGASGVLIKEGILDMTSYIMGLSGSGWFLTSVLGEECLHDLAELTRHKEKIRKGMKTNLYKYLVDVHHHIKFDNYVRTKTSESQPYSFIDFYGFTLGRNLFKKQLKKVFSSLQSYVESGKIPFPVITALHVEADSNSEDFNVHTEMNPYEVSLPNFAINIPTEQFGSQWHSGILIRQCKEAPIHFMQGMTGSALGITFDEFQSLLEKDEEFKEEVDRRKNARFISAYRRTMATIRRKRNESSTSSKKGRNNLAFTSIVEEHTKRVKAEELEKEKEEQPHVKPESHVIENNNHKASHTVQMEKLNGHESDTNKVKEDNLDNKDKNANSGANLESKETKTRDCCYKRKEGTVSRYRNSRFKDNLERQMSSKEKKSMVQDTNVNSSGLKKLLRKLLSNREFLLDRTAKVLNFATALEDVQYFHLSMKPGQDHDGHDSKKDLASSDKPLCFVDAAVSSNLPINAAIRPQRKSDVLIVLDFSEYKGDEDIDYSELFKAEKKARAQGLMFPSIDKRKLAKDPLNEVHVFKDDNPECPIVIWFTLSSFNYKKHVKDNYNKVNCCGRTKSEADFSVFGAESEYPTLKAAYTGKEFDKLTDLMTYNVSKNIDKIKDVIKESIHQKKK